MTHAPSSPRRRGPGAFTKADAQRTVVPAEAGTQGVHEGGRRRTHWIPAFAGMTGSGSAAFAGMTGSGSGSGSAAAGMTGVLPTAGKGLILGQLREGLAELGHLRRRHRHA